MFYGFAPPELALEQYYEDIERRRFEREEMIRQAIEEDDQETLIELGFIKKELS